MTEFEIALAQAYLNASGQDAIMALIRSVKDLAKSRRLLAAAGELDLPICDLGHHLEAETRLDGGQARLALPCHA